MLAIRKRIVLISAVLVVALALGGCLGQQSGPPQQGQPAEQPTPVEPPVPAEPAATVTAYVYFGQGRDVTKVVPVQRDIAEPPAGASATEQTAWMAGQLVAALISGPTEAEQAEGLWGGLPAGTRLNNVRVERPYVYLDFNEAFGRTGGTAEVAGMLTQIEYTLAGLDTIKGVVLTIDGQRVGTEQNPFTGEGFLFDVLYPPLDDTAWLATLTPDQAFDLFVVVIPNPDDMWQLLGPAARQRYRSPQGIETSAFAEGLGNWHDYTIESVQIDGDTATVDVSGEFLLEGSWEARRQSFLMVREDGIWKWDLFD